MFAKGASSIDKESLKAAMRELGTCFPSCLVMIERFPRSSALLAST